MHRKQILGFLLFLLTGCGPLTENSNSSSWVATSCGNWSDSVNWTSPDSPEGSNRTATFPDYEELPTALVTLDRPLHLENLQFSATSNTTYTLAGNASNKIHLYSSVVTLGPSQVVPVVDADIVLHNHIHMQIDGKLRLRSAIDGEFGIIKTGSETLVLEAKGASKANTYRGTTYITEGTLQALEETTDSLSPHSPIVLADVSHATLDLNGTDNTIPSLAGGGNVLLGSGTLTVGDDTSTLYSGIISGTGGLIKRGNGTLTLAGSNLYEGGIYLQSGQVTVENDSALGTGPVTLADTTSLHLKDGIIALNPITLAADGIGTIHIASGVGHFSGATTETSGSLAKTGEGTLVLDNCNQHTGATYLQEGSLILKHDLALGAGPLTLFDETLLQFVDGIAISNPIAIAPESTATLFVDAEQKSTLLGDFTSTTGALTKTGTGTVTFQGEHSYTGTTTVSEGMVVVNGSSLSPFLLESGTTLKGTGRVGSLHVTNGAAVIPGNSVGTLYSGPVTFDPDSIFSVEIDPSAASSLIVTGSANLDGHVQIIQNEGSYAPKGRYLILDATDITGAFQSIEGGFEGFTFSFEQIGHQLYLLYTTPVPLISLNGLSGNALTLATAFNNTEDLSFLSLLSPLTGTPLQEALNAISPARNAFSTYLNAQTAFSLSTLLTTHLDTFRFTPLDRLCKSGCGLWFSGFGEFGHRTASLQNPAFDYLSEAVLLGLDVCGTQRGLFGLSLGYAHTHFSEDQSFGHGDTHSFSASLYGNRFFGHLYLSPSLWVLLNQTDQTRNISFTGFSQKAEADISAWQLIPHLELGLSGENLWADIIPFSALDWAILWQKGYTEKGASPFNAEQTAQQSSLLRSETGLKLWQRWEKKWGSFVLKEKVAYVFEKPFGLGTVQATFEGINDPFTVHAVDQSVSLGAVGLDFLFKIGRKQPFNIELDYEGEFSSSFISNEFMLTFSKDF